jgi:benzoylformate decarboxylase
MPPLALMHAVAEALPPEAVVVDETISSGAGLRTFLKSDDPKSFFGLRGGGIGWGLPAAIGVKLALPSRPVVGLIGDGSAMYTCQALWTAARYRVPVVLVILNNASYRILKQRIHAMKGLAAQADRYVGMDLEDPRVDFVGLAQSLGVEAERVEKTAEVAPALGRALGRGGPTLLDVELERSFKSA